MNRFRPPWIGSTDNPILQKEHSVQDWSLEDYLEIKRGHEGVEVVERCETWCPAFCNLKLSKEKELSFLCFPKCKIRKEKWKMKVCCDEGKLLAKMEHTTETRLDYQPLFGKMNRAYTETFVLFSFSYWWLLTNSCWGSQVGYCNLNILLEQNYNSSTCQRHFF